MPDLAPWRSPLSRALHRNRALAYARYLQLATVRTDGRPANRTVVFRGFLDPGNQLKFITDGRSAKVEQMQRHPWGEVCWYFPKTHEQFRLRGSLMLVQAHQTDSALRAHRQQQWRELSDNARLQFTWPTPGDPRAAAESFAALAPEPESPPDCFCLGLLVPTQVDHLELRGEPQNRTLYTQTETAQTGDRHWISQSVNP
jgi:pyridoxamine 5'-phosphate oxidase